MPMLRETGWLSTPFRRLMDNFLNAEKFFDDEFVKGDFMPAVNIKENKDHYEIEVAAPGMKREDFVVTVENDMLVIAAERKEEKEEKEDNYTRREFAYNSFRRAFALPENIREKDIEARYMDGILHLKVKRIEKPAPEIKKIAIK